MAKFAYKAVDSSGKEVRSVVIAESQAEAISKIRGMKLTPTAIGQMKESSESAASNSVSSPADAPAPKAKKKGSGLSMDIKLPSFLRGSVKTKDLMVLTRQLATLIDAGLPLTRGLTVLHRQATNPVLKETLADMLETVKTGNTFSESLGNHPKIFNHLYVNMVKAGEAGGVLETVLNRLAEFMEKAEKIKNKVKGAMTYPAVVLCAAVGIVVFLMVKVIPQFQKIFQDLMGGAEMPGLTQFVIDMSEYVQANWMTVGIGIAAAAVAFKIFAKTEKGAYLCDVMALKAPAFGSLTQRNVVARLTRTLGTLLASGVPVLQALSIVKDTTGNRVVANALQSVHDNVKEGEGMTEPLAASGVFPPMVVSMVEVGEETGALPDMLIRIANTYDDEVDNAVASLTSIIEPIMIIFLALVVGGIVIAMFLPLINIIGTLGGGAA